MALFPSVNYNHPAEIALTSQDTLRKTVGILGMLLPVLLFLTLWIDLGHTHPMESISHYYHTRASGVFVIVVSMMAVFLMIYKGYKPIDFYTSTIAGVCAMLLLLFPTGNIKSVACCDSYAVSQLKPSDFREIFHLATAGIFLAALAFMSLFLFTQSDKGKLDRGRAKRRRNRIFRTCGGVMIAALLTIIAGFTLDGFQPFYDEHQMTFWMESLAVWAFGFSWFVKGEAIIKDRTPSDEPRDGSSTVVLSTDKPVIH